MAERGFQSESEVERLRAELEECKALLQSQGIDSDEVRDKSLDRVVQTKQFKEFRRQFQKKNEQIHPKIP